MNSRKKTIISIVVGVAVLALLAVGVTLRWGVERPAAVMDFEPQREASVTITFEEGAFAPKKFTVGTNTVLTLTLVSRDAAHRILRFETPLDFMTGVLPGRISTVTITTPLEKGSYTFFDETRPRGEGNEGVMVVK